jgi:hypothetical protein
MQYTIDNVELPMGANDFAIHSGTPGSELGNDNMQQANWKNNAEAMGAVRDVESIGFVGLDSNIVDNFGDITANMAGSGNNQQIVTGGFNPSIFEMPPTQPMHQNHENELRLVLNDPLQTDARTAIQDYTDGIMEDVDWFASEYSRASDAVGVHNTIISLLGTRRKRRRIV